ncbi:PHB depolymerase family esterase [Synechococcus sp. Cruz CV-v-12]|uniref:extracellular catalytic domain type 1 short-chain-length polyhydroxyalkanoate depolymerase n=2 Tax=unclassified Synechococcus TaxID=2626047 RepID=UPI0020CE5802|nr:PHB depolymerase family esterase [Synechococcus sp. Cruz CV-v-12]
MRLVTAKFVGMLTCLLMAGSLIGCDHTIATEYSGPLRNFLQQRREERRQGIRPGGRQQEDVSVLGPNFQSLVLSHQGRMRDYLLYTPPSYNPNSPTPVVFGFHGGTSYNVRFARTTNLHKLADEKGFLVVYPNAVNKNWNDGRGTVNQDIDDVGFVTALIEEVKRLRNVDARRVYVTGISNGAFLVQRLACERSDRIAAFSSIAGSMPTPLRATCNPSKPVSIMMINSPNDPFVPWEGGEGKRGKGGSILSILGTVDFWRQRDGCRASNEETLPDNVPGDNTRVYVRRYGDCLGNTAVVLYRIEGGGHTWPGGADQPAWLLGATSQKLNATRVSWNFFQMHTLPQ